jgi:predicted aspartyl protease
MCDRDFLMSENSNNNPTSTPIQIRCPEILIQINNVKVNALIDTGSSITCLSESWFKDNQQLMKPYEELPLTNTVIKTATGERSKRVSRIIYAPVTLENQTTYLQFLIVPNLIKPVILGVDVLAILKMDINFDTNELNMYMNNVNIILKFDMVFNEGQLCIITDDHCHRQINIYEDEMSNINNDNLMYEEYDNRYNDFHEAQPKTPCNNIALSEETINESLSTNTYIDEQQRKSLCNLLQKYNHVFSDEPGRCNKYEHDLVVKNPQNFKSNIYPVL